jgi:hypothetical protein
MSDQRLRDGRPGEAPQERRVAGDLTISEMVFLLLLLGAAVVVIVGWIFSH